ncbi:three component ABC system middle component [Vibrio lentus]
MANAIVHIDNIHNNAYILAPIIESFYEGADKRTRNLLLSYLVLPLILHEESRVKILKSNIRSSIYTIFSDASILYGINERVQSFKETTNKCILLSSMENSLNIDSDMSVEFISRNIDYSFCNVDKIKSAKKLAALFNSHDIVEIFRKLGINKI